MGIAEAERLVIGRQRRPFEHLARRPTRCAVRFEPRDRAPNWLGLLPDDRGILNRDRRTSVAASAPRAAEGCHRHGPVTPGSPPAASMPAAYEPSSVE